MTVRRPLATLSITSAPRRAPCRFGVREDALDLEAEATSTAQARDTKSTNRGKAGSNYCSHAGTTRRRRRRSEGGSSRGRSCLRRQSSIASVPARRTGKRAGAWLTRPTMRVGRTTLRSWWRGKLRHESSLRPWQARIGLPACHRCRRLPRTLGKQDLCRLSKSSHSSLHVRRSCLLSGGAAPAR